MIRRKKSSIRSKTRGTTIGVMGVGNSVGTTTITIAFAHYLQSSGYRIALLEMGKREAFAQIEQYVEGYSSDEETFCYRGVDYYKEVEDSSVSNILSRDYDFFLFDLGYGRSTIKELIRSDYKLAVMTHSEWRNRDIINFLQDYCREEWFVDIIFVHNLHTKDTHSKGRNKDYKKEVQINKKINIPLIWDKYKIAPEVREVFREIVELN